MKKILGIHPLLVSLLAIILALTIFDRIKPKDAIVEPSVVKPSSRNTKESLTQNDPIFYAIDKQTDYEIDLFNHKKWYKTKSENTISNSQVSTLTAKPMVQVASVTPITPKSIKTTSDKVKQEKTTVVQIAKPIPEPTHALPTNNQTDIIPQSIPQPITLPEPKVSYIGKYDDKDRQYVFLEVDGNSKAVGLNQAIDGHTKITAIGKNNIQLTDTRTGSTKTLPTE